MLQCVLDNLPNKKKERCNFCKNPPSVGSICAFRGSHKLGQSMKGSLRFHLRNALFITGSPPHPDMEGINTGPRWTTEIPPVLLCLGGWLSLPNENKHSQHSSPCSNQPSGLVSKALHHYGNKKRKRDECWWMQPSRELGIRVSVTVWLFSWFNTGLMQVWLPSLSLSDFFFSSSFLWTCTLTQPEMTVTFSNVLFMSHNPTVYLCVLSVGQKTHSSRLLHGAPDHCTLSAAASLIKCCQPGQHQENQLSSNISACTVIVC